MEISIINRRGLRFSNELDQKWGIALGRNTKPYSESSFWPYITRRESSFTGLTPPLSAIADETANTNPITTNYINNFSLFFPPS